MVDNNSLQLLQADWTLYAGRASSRRSRIFRGSEPTGRRCGSMDRQLRALLFSTVMKCLNNDLGFRITPVTYHIILRFAISDHHSDAVLDPAGSLRGGEDVVHCKPDGPARLQNRASQPTDRQLTCSVTVGTMCSLPSSVHCSSTEYYKYNGRVWILIL